MKTKKTFDEVVKADLRNLYKIGTRAVIIMGLNFSGVAMANQNLSAEYLSSAFLTGAFYLFIELARFKGISTERYKNIKPLVFP